MEASSGGKSTNARCLTSVDPTSAITTLVASTATTRVFAKWLTSHCPHAKTLLGTCCGLFDFSAAATTTTKPSKDGGGGGGDGGRSSSSFVVVVETASGTRVGRFEFSEGSTTVRDVSRQLRLSAQSPSSEFVACRHVLLRLGDGTATPLQPTTTLAQVLGMDNNSAPAKVTSDRSSTVLTSAADTAVVALVELVVMLVQVAWDPALSHKVFKFYRERPHRVPRQRNRRQCARVCRLQLAVGR